MGKDIRDSTGTNEEHSVNWFNEHLYSKLVLFVMSVPCTFVLVKMSVSTQLSLCTFMKRFLWTRVKTKTTTNRGIGKLSAFYLILFYFIKMCSVYLLLCCQLFCFDSRPQRSLHKGTQTELRGQCDILQIKFVCKISQSVRLSRLSK